jgi:transposase InsO family protein
MIGRIIEARQRWGWGPRKLLVKLAAAMPNERLPSASTVAELLHRKGLSHARMRRPRTPLYEQPFADVSSANQTWCADFKGWFRTQEGTRCDPLTMTDAHSRYLLCCQIVAKTDRLHVEALFDAAFREYGLPDVIHTDNGPPFASRAPRGLSRLSMRWVRLGIVAERSRPSSPQDNGRHERMHRSLKEETLKPPARNPTRQQDRFNAWQNVYNHERPHEALDYLTPAACYRPHRERFRGAYRRWNMTLAFSYAASLQKAISTGKTSASLSAKSLADNRSACAPIMIATTTCSTARCTSAGSTPSSISTIATSQNRCAESTTKACANDGAWKEWKSKTRIPTLSTHLGNRSAIPTFPQP